MVDPNSPAGFMLAKAARVCEAGLRRWAVPRTRAELLDCAAVLRSRVRQGKDPILKSLGYSVAGMRHFLETEYLLPFDEADIIASAMADLVERYKPMN